MIIKLKKDKSNYEEGCYSVVFKDYENNCAIKIFKKHPGVNRLFCSVNSSAVYFDEIKAYELIWSLTTDDAENLRALVPRYYGSCEIKSIFNDEMQDISGEYDLNLNYRMELLDGKFIKIHQKILRNEYKNDLDKYKMNEIPENHRNYFKNCEIYHIHDLSTLNDVDGNIIKYIDFRAGSIDDIGDLQELIPPYNV